MATWPTVAIVLARLAARRRLLVETEGRRRRLVHCAFRRLRQYRRRRGATSSLLGTTRRGKTRLGTGRTQAGRGRIRLGAAGRGQNLARGRRHAETSSNAPFARIRTKTSLRLRSRHLLILTITMPPTRLQIRFIARCQSRVHLHVSVRRVRVLCIQDRVRLMTTPSRRSSRSASVDQRLAVVCMYRLNGPSNIRPASR